MDPLDQSFHGSFKPRWGPDGSCIVAAPLEMGGSTLDRVNVFSQNGPAAEDPLDGIRDHQKLVDITTVNGIPTVSTRRVHGLKVFSVLRADHFAVKPVTMVPFEQERRSYELSVWELASTLFDPTGSRSDAAEERQRREKLAKFWATLVQGASGAVDQRASPEEKAILYLAQRKIPDACRALLDGKEPRLGTMLSLIGTSDSFK
jgi:nuclear pore complex protein Nup98-Nup96